MLLMEVISRLAGAIYHARDSNGHQSDKPNCMIDWHCFVVEPIIASLARQNMQPAVLAHVNRGVWGVGIAL